MKNVLKICFALLVSCIANQAFAQCTGIFAVGQVCGNPSSSVAGTPRGTNSPIFGSTLTIGINGTATGTLLLKGLTSGTVTVTPQAIAGTATFTLPNASGTPAISVPSPLTLSVTTGAVTWTGLTTNGLFYATGATAVTQTAQGGANTILIANSGAPSFSAAPTIGTSVTSPLVIATTSATSPLLYGGSAVGSALIIQGTSNGSPSGDHIDFKSGTKDIWHFKQNPAGDVGGVYVECWPGNSAGFQNAECDVVSSISTGGISFRMKGDWPFVIHAPADQSASAKMCIYEQESNGTNRMCWYAASSIASDFTLVWPNAVATVNNQALVGSTGGTLSWATYTQTTTTTVGGLVACAAGTKGARWFVTDSNAASFTVGIGAVVAAGGATNVPVVCDGTNWRIG